MLGLVLVLAGVGALAVFGSGLFAVQDDQLHVVGAVYTDPDRLAQIEDESSSAPRRCGSTPSGSSASSSRSRGWKEQRR